MTDHNDRKPNSLPVLFDHGDSPTIPQETPMKHIWIMRSWTDDPEPLRVPIVDDQSVADAMRSAGAVVPAELFAATPEGKQLAAGEMLGGMVRDGAIVRCSQMEMVPGGGERAGEHGASAGRGLRSVVALIAFVVASLAAPTLGHAEGTVAVIKDEALRTLLDDVHKARSAVEILDDQVTKRTDDIISAADACWGEHGDELRAVMSREIRDVVSDFRVDASSFEVFLKQYKAVIDDGESVNVIVDSAVRRTWQQVSPLLRKAAEDARGQQVACVEEALGEAQDAIVEETHAAVRKYFPSVDGVVIFSTSPLEAEADTNVQAVLENLDGQIGLKTGGGIAVLLTRRLVERLAIKLGAKGLARFIPVIGWVMIGGDAYEAATARRELEVAVRTELLKEAHGKIDLALAWHGVAGGPDRRSAATKAVERSLVSFTSYAKSRAKDLANVGPVMSNRHLGAWLDRHGEDTPREVVVRQLANLWTDFGKLAVEQPLTTLQDVQLAAGGLALRPLADALSTDLLKEFERGGAAFLRVGRLLGTDLTKHLCGKQTNWSELAMGLEPYHHVRDMQSLRGVLVCLDEGLPCMALTDTQLRDVHRHRELVVQLSRVGAPAEMMLSIVTSASLRALTTELQRFEALFGVVLRRASLEQLSMLRGAETREALLQLFDYAGAERGWSIDAFGARLGEILDDEVPMVRREGSLAGVRQYDRLLREDGLTPSEARDRVERSILLVEQGYPAEVRGDSARFERADRVAGLFPLGGPIVYRAWNALEPALPWLKWVILGVIAPFLTAVSFRVLVGAWRFATSGFQATGRPTTPAPPRGRATVPSPPDATSGATRSVATPSHQRGGAMPRIEPTLVAQGSRRRPRR